MSDSSDQAVKPVPIYESWGTASRVFCVIGGAIVIFAGLMLAGVRAAGENSMIQSIANGMGIYFIGKGLFMIGIAANLKAAVRLMRVR